MPNQTKEHFQRAAKDVFVLNKLPDVGIITKIRIGHVRELFKWFNFFTFFKKL